MAKRTIAATTQTSEATKMTFITLRVCCIRTLTDKKTRTRTSAPMPNAQFFVVTSPAQRVSVGLSVVTPIVRKAEETPKTGTRKARNAVLTRYQEVKLKFAASPSHGCKARLT